MDEKAGSTVSIFPFGDSAKGVTLKGFRYPLEDAVLQQGVPIGISNIVEKEKAEIIVGEGVLLVIIQ